MTNKGVKIYYMSQYYACQKIYNFEMYSQK